MRETVTGAAGVLRREDSWEETILLPSCGSLRPSPGTSGLGSGGLHLLSHLASPGHAILISLLLKIKLW